MTIEIVTYDLTKDYDAIKELMNELTSYLGQKFDERRFTLTLSRRMSDSINNDGILLAKEDGKIIGMIWGEVVSYPTKHGQISNFIIKKEYRGKGAGKKLINAVIKFFVRNNVSHVQANARNMEKEGKLYERFGFKKQYSVMETKLSMDYFAETY
ncbi:MAG: GNAT family N-acetyltransferase [Candidatus Helarchaeota archaeon]